MFESGKYILFVVGFFKHWGNSKTATFVMIEDGRKDGRGVEVRVRHEVDRAVHPHQGYGVEVSDDAVVFNWLIGHNRKYSVNPSLRRPHQI